MSVIVLLIIAGGAVALGFLGAFVWAVRSGQYDDTLTPAVRMLLDERMAADTERAGNGNPHTELEAPRAPAAQGRDSRG